MSLLHELLTSCVLLSCALHSVLVSGLLLSASLWSSVSCPWVLTGIPLIPLCQWGRSQLGVHSGSSANLISETDVPVCRVRAPVGANNSCSSFGTLCVVLSAHDRMRSFTISVLRHPGTLG